MAEISSRKDGVSLRVSPEVLVEKAETVLKDILDLKQAFERVEQKIDGTNSYWNGEAGEQYRQIYNEQREDIRMITNKLQATPTKLREIGRSYMGTEKEAQEMSETLSGNVIV